MIDQAIAFIGAGNMAQSLIGGLLADNFPAGNIVAADPDAEKRAALSEALGVRGAADNGVAVSGASIVVLAVKPQLMSKVVKELAGEIKNRQPLLISIAAGIRAADIARWAGCRPAIVRVMPNTPALLGCGASALYANSACSDQQREAAEAILRAVGVTVWLDDEQLLDPVTAVSGSGPAYFFYLMELLEQHAVRLGLPPDSARILTLQTALGAARMALESDTSVAELRSRVTSPGGTTEAGLRVLGAPEFGDTVGAALDAACRRAAELATEFGKE